MTGHKHTQCKHLLGSLSDYIDGELEEQVCQEIERHLLECNNCRVVIDTLRKTIEVYHQESQSSTIPPGVKERLFFKLDLHEYLEKDS